VINNAAFLITQKHCVLVFAMPKTQSMKVIFNILLGLIISIHADAETFAAYQEGRFTTGKCEEAFEHHEDLFIKSADPSVLKINHSYFLWCNDENMEDGGVFSLNS
jgi:hypothetical protein